MRYESETMGISVAVRPRFSLANSDPGTGTYVFDYDVELRNRSAETVQLVFRHWHIHDSVGEDTVVDGEGVVGEQPVMIPGAVHQYTSFCVLRSPVGYMEGYYTFVGPEGTDMRVAIPRFALQAPLPPPEGLEPTALTN